jgi:hypothetical protein
MAIWWLHARNHTSAPVHPHTHTHTHTHREICKVYCFFYGNNGFVNAPHCYVTRTLPLLLSAKAGRTQSNHRALRG